jgi:hypothetical protein
MKGKSEETKEHGKAYSAKLRLGGKKVKIIKQKQNSAKVWNSRVNIEFSKNKVPLKTKTINI